MKELSVRKPPKAIILGSIELLIIALLFTASCVERLSNGAKAEQQMQASPVEGKITRENAQSGITGENARKVKRWASIELKLVADGFHMPTFLGNAGDGSGRIFVVEKPGAIRIIKDGKVKEGEPFIVLVDRVRATESERGLLSVAFHPKYRDNGKFYVDYTTLDGTTIVSEFRVSETNPDRADKGTERILLKIPQPAANHNGGQLQFGPDRYLYIGMGDGGGAGDPWGNAQNLTVLLGKLLRIDVNSGDPYSIPKDNPFVGKQNVKPEIYAYGLRNPWRFSFDRATGDLYIADVGQNKWEEIDFQPSGTAGGQNYGWDLLEGFHDFEMKAEQDRSALTPPILEYGHNLGISITGGYVYRGKKFPRLAGTYFFADFGTGTVWGLRKTERSWEWAEFKKTSYAPSSFGEDEDGELYLVDYGGRIFQIVEASER